MSFIAQIYEALMPTVVPDPAPCGDHKPTPNYSFDPASYPHLFDGIIATADIDTLAALRNTCRTLRGRISSLLEHVVIRRRPYLPRSVEVVPYQQQHEGGAVSVELKASSAWAATRIVDMYRANSATMYGRKQPVNQVAPLPQLISYLFFPSLRVFRSVYERDSIRRWSSCVSPIFPSRASESALAYSVEAPLKRRDIKMFMTTCKEYQVDKLVIIAPAWSTLMSKDDIATAVLVTSWSLLEAKINLTFVGLAPPSPTDDNDDVEIPECIRFLSRDEYQVVVGDEMFQLQSGA